MKKSQTKKEYNSLQNIRWMISIANKECKSVVFFCVFIAVLTFLLSFTKLIIAPEILKKVEEGVTIPSLVKTILLLTGTLLVLTGLPEYFTNVTLWGRVSVRSVIVAMINEKSNTTSYPNLLDPRVLKLRDKAYAATGNNDEASEHIWSTISVLLTDVLGFIVYLILLKNLNPVLLAVVITTTLVSFLISRKTDTWAYRHREEDAEFYKKERYISSKAESIKLAKDIRLFGMSSWIKDIWNGVIKLHDAFEARNQKKLLLGNMAGVVMTVLRNGIAYLYLINMAINNGLPASTFLLYFTAVSGFTEWVNGILTECGTLHKESLELNIIREYLDVSEPFRFEDGISLPSLSDGCRIDLRNVSFRYPEAAEDTIKDITLSIMPGEKVAIVGLNGAGKTTLVKLICGLLDPTEGEVLLNGINIREFNRREYYGLFATVFQDFSVLAISIAENVAQSDTGIDTDKVKEALRLAGLQEKVSELPKGINTMLGREMWDDGVELSGGEIQKLMLARALYRNSPVLLLDEPTAALDPIAENDIYTRYNEMTSGKTNVFISHRLASTRFCDRIVFLSGGRISEEGTHDELVERNGEYAGLFEVQSRYYKEGRDF